MNKDSVAYKLMVKSKYHHRLQEIIREEEEKRKRKEEEARLAQLRLEREREERRTKNQQAVEAIYNHIVTEMEKSLNDPFNPVDWVCVKFPVMQEKLEVVECTSSKRTEFWNVDKRTNLRCYYDISLKQGSLLLFDDLMKMLVKNGFNPNVYIKPITYDYSDIEIDILDDLRIVTEMDKKDAPDFYIALRVSCPNILKENLS